MAKEIKVIVSDAELDDGNYENCDDVSINHNLKVFDLWQVLEQPWFLELLRQNGFYSKDEISKTDLSHLDNFVYEFKYKGSDYINLEKSPQYLLDNDIVTAVYQEVLGPERISAYAKW